MRRHRPPDETPTLPPISVLTTTYAFTQPPLPSLCSRGALPTSLILMLTKVPSRYAPDTAYHPYACACPPNTAYHPYARGVHSRHAPDTTYPYACVVPSQHHLSLRLCGALPTCSRHHLSLRSRSASQHAPDTTYPYASVLHP
ncbi:hypothetical protein O181_100097 [Austropuccinia psidii MF-1]|uniref:Uncharacterized protein n=1 Tax=Austropuccinia psidii MF-1 TaxID=1389203 RepID=A0A9Q3JDI7_9BASI|nr:hypothetical protein [Austropuccinia psidii MF-1]